MADKERKFAFPAHVSRLIEYHQSIGCCIYVNKELVKDGEGKVTKVIHYLCTSLCDAVRKPDGKPGFYNMCPHHSEEVAKKSKERKDAERKDNRKEIVGIAEELGVGEKKPARGWAKKKKPADAVVLAEVMEKVKEEAKE